MCWPGQWTTNLLPRFAAKIKAKTIDGTVRDMEAKALVDRKTDTLLDVRESCRHIELCEVRLN